MVNILKRVFDRVTEREGRRRRASTYWFIPETSKTARSGPDWNQESGTSSQVTYVGVWALLPCFPTCIVRKLQPNWNIWTLTPHPYGMLAPQSMFFNQLRKKKIVELKAWYLYCLLCLGNIIVLKLSLIKISDFS